MHLPVSVALPRWPLFSICTGSGECVGVHCISLGCIGPFCHTSTRLCTSYPCHKVVCSSSDCKDRLCTGEGCDSEDNDCEAEDADVCTETVYSYTDTAASTLTTETSTSCETITVRYVEAITTTTTTTTTIDSTDVMTVALEVGSYGDVDLSVLTSLASEDESTISKMCSTPMVREWLLDNNRLHKQLRKQIVPKNGRWIWRRAGLVPHIVSFLASMRYFVHILSFPPPKLFVPVPGHSLFHCPGNDRIFKFDFSIVFVVKKKASKWYIVYETF